MSDLEARVAATAGLLREAAEKGDMPVSPDGRVRECDAEQLLAYAPGSFRTMRDLGTAPAYYIASVSGSRYSYRLADLAAWLETRREEPAL